MKLVDARLVGGTKIANQRKCKQTNRDVLKILFYFGLSCKKVIYSFNTSPQVEKEKKRGGGGVMDINLRYVAAVTSLGGVLAVKTFNRPNNRLYAIQHMGMLSAKTKGHISSHGHGPTRRKY